MASSPSFSSHKVHCEDIWPFDKLIADGETDLANRLASSELSMTDELDKFQNFEREIEVLRMIQKWLSSPLATSPYDSVDQGFQPCFLMLQWTLHCQLFLLLTCLSPDFLQSPTIQLGSLDLLLSQTIEIDSQVSLEPFTHYLLIFHPPIWTRLTTLKSYLQHDTILGTVTQQWFFYHDINAD